MDLQVVSGAEATNVAPRKIDIKIEVCIDSIESALAAVRGGADRLEICGNLALGGGTTPSVGLVRLVKEVCPEHIELMAMVRPRTGDFLYSAYEMAIMHADIQAFAALGVSGVVFGALSADGTTDVDNTRSLVETALQYGLQVCFHRAFDMVVDQQEALRMLVTIPGITRILTSGGAPSATQGLSSLIQLCTALPKPHVEIMPGSGVNLSTVGPLLSTLLHLDVRAVHLSEGGWVENDLELAVEGGMQYRPKRMGMGVGGEGEWKVWRTREETVRAVRDIVDREWLAFSSRDT